jgi:flagellar hook-basal body complex protein FliE
MSVSPITSAGLLPAVKPAAASTGPADGASFADSLKSLVSSVDSTAGAANSAVSQMVGGTGDVHSAMIALQEAEMTLQLTVQIKNKLMQAYQDVMRMSI